VFVVVRFTAVDSRRVRYKWDVCEHGNRVLSAMSLECWHFNGWCLVPWPCPRKKQPVQVRMMNPREREWAYKYKQTTPRDNKTTPCTLHGDATAAVHKLHDAARCGSLPTRSPYDRGRERAHYDAVLSARGELRGEGMRERRATTSSSNPFLYVCQRNCCSMDMRIAASSM